MESYYDSDEDVCWGPITLREIKRDLTRRGKQQLKSDYSRQTIYHYPNLEFENLKLNTQANATSSTNMDYCTANETVGSTKSDYKECRQEKDEEVISLSSDEDEVPIDIKYEDISDISSDVQLQESNCGSNLEDSWRRTEQEFVDEGLELTKQSNEISGNSSEASIDQEQLHVDMKNQSEDDSFNDTLDELNDFLSESSVKSETNSRIPIPEERSRTGTNFKVPVTPKFTMKAPSSTKLPVMKDNHKLTAVKESVDKYKSIISPVRLYIKNSPLPVLKQNSNSNIQRLKNSYSSNDDLRARTTIVRRRHKNIVDSFPEVFYKPSKTVTLNNFNKIMLPDNIKNLVKEPLITKHVIRRKINLDESFTPVEWKLKRGDLSGVVNDEKNMSVHQTKQGFKI